MGIDALLRERAMCAHFDPSPGAALADSDIDFLVERGPNPSPFFPGGLLMDLEEL
jgi:hypothetical protein